MSLNTRSRHDDIGEDEKDSIEKTEIEELSNCSVVKVLGRAWSLNSECGPRYVTIYNTILIV
jgi:hypothetical protein